MGSLTKFYLFLFLILSTSIAAKDTVFDLLGWLYHVSMNQVCRTPASEEALLCQRILRHRRLKHLFEMFCEFIGGFFIKITSCSPHNFKYWFSRVSDENPWRQHSQNLILLEEPGFYRTMNALIFVMRLWWIGIRSVKSSKFIHYISFRQKKKNFFVLKPVDSHNIGQFKYQYIGWRHWEEAMGKI